MLELQMLKAWPHCPHCPPKLGSDVNKKAQELKEEDQARTRDRVKLRKDNREKKVFLGNFLLDQVKKQGADSTIRSWIESELPAYLKTDRERELLQDLLRKDDTKSV
jgi:hypothetical protein